MALGKIGPVMEKNCSSWDQKQYDIPSKIIRLIWLTLTNKIAKVKINSHFTVNFNVETRVKQGDSLSATLFTVVLDNVLKQMDLRGNTSTRLKQCSAYADNIVITTRTKQSITDTFKGKKKYQRTLA
jgi:hypothetical protein